MLESMYDAGCRAIFFGMESGSPKIQQEIRKNLDLGEASRIVRKSASLGIYTVVSFMMGFPDETEEDLNMTLRAMVRETAFGIYAQLTQLSVLPGTPMFDRHHHQLEYDHTHSGFSSIHPTPRTLGLIRLYPDLFSSFYHLPNPGITRDTFHFIAETANFLECFIPTLSLVRDFLIPDLPSINPVEYIRTHKDNYLKREKNAVPGLSFITDSIRNYLVWLDQCARLPEHAWDVFLVDFTRAHMIAKFKYWQLLGTLNETSRTETIAKSKVEVRSGQRILRQPYWTLVETSHYVYDFILEPIRRREKAFFRRGRYHYLVLPFSHRLANIYKIPAKEAPVYQRLADGSTVREIIRENRENLKEDRILQIIRRMVRLGLLEIQSGKHE
jgi:hypothetical protein